MIQLLKKVGDLADILVSATRKIDHYHCVFFQRVSKPHQLRNSVSALERGNNPFQPAQKLKCFECLLVSNRCVLDPADIMEVSMFRPHAWVIESGGNGVSAGDLPVLVLQNIDQRTLENSGPGRRESRR